jgi:hypothetical protein
LWDVQPSDADTCFGRVLRETAKGTRPARAQDRKTDLLFPELRRKVEIHNLTGRLVVLLLGHPVPQVTSRLLKTSLR